MHMTGPPDEPIRIDNLDIEAINDFTFLGSVISSDNGVKKEIQEQCYLCVTVLLNAGG